MALRGSRRPIGAHGRALGPGLGADVVRQDQGLTREHAAGLASGAAELADHRAVHPVEFVFVHDLVLSIELFDALVAGLRANAHGTSSSLPTVSRFSISAWAFVASARRYSPKIPTLSFPSAIQSKRRSVWARSSAGVAMWSRNTA